jgi:hypothetical protein
MDGGETELPESWSRSDGETYCLSCSRALAGEAAMESAPASSSREERVRLRRTALIEFEIGRAPEATNGIIARACRTSGAAVQTVRSGLENPPATAPDAGASVGA